MRLKDPLGAHDNTHTIILGVRPHPIPALHVLGDALLYVVLVPGHGSGSFLLIVQVVRSLARADSATLRKFVSWLAEPAHLVCPRRGLVFVLVEIHFDKWIIGLIWLFFTKPWS